MLPPLAGSSFCEEDPVPDPLLLLECILGSSSGGEGASPTPLFTVPTFVLPGTLFVLALLLLLVLFTTALVLLLLDDTTVDDDEKEEADALADTEEDTFCGWVVVCVIFATVVPATSDNTTADAEDR